jgi:hypothetical protein
VEKLLTRSNKIWITLTYLGEGVVGFQVPPLHEKTKVHLWFGKKKTENGIRSSLFGRGSVFRDMIKNVFIKGGGIALNGYLSPITEENFEHPDFRTVIQIDDHVICKIKESIFEREDFSQLLLGYDQMRQQFLEAFRDRFRFKILQVLAVFSGFLSLLGLYQLLIYWKIWP